MFEQHLESIARGRRQRTGLRAGQRTAQFSRYSEPTVFVFLVGSNQRKDELGFLDRGGAGERNLSRDDPLRLGDENLRGRLWPLLLIRLLFLFFRLTRMSRAAVGNLLLQSPDIRHNLKSLENIILFKNRGLVVNFQSLTSIDGGVVLSKSILVTVGHSLRAAARAMRPASWKLFLRRSTLCRQVPAARDSAKEMTPLHVRPVSCSPKWRRVRLRSRPDEIMSMSPSSPKLL